MCDKMKEYVIDINPVNKIVNYGSMEEIERVKKMIEELE